MKPVVIGVPVAVAGLLAAVLLLRTDAPPPDRAARLVPAHAAVYVNLATDRSRVQWERAERVLAQLPGVSELLEDAVAGVAPTGSGLELDPGEPPEWLGSEAALAVLAEPGARAFAGKHLSHLDARPDASQYTSLDRHPRLADSSLSATPRAAPSLVLERPGRTPTEIGTGGVLSRSAAAVERARAGRRARRETLLLLAVAPGGEREVRALVRAAARAGSRERRRGVRIARARGLALALDGGFLLAGPPAAVRAAIDTRAGEAPSLATGATYAGLVERLPVERLAHAYASEAALGAGRGTLPALASLAGDLAGGAHPRAAAASLGLEGGRGRIVVRSLASPSDSVRGAHGAEPCADARGAKPRLLSTAPLDTAAFLEVARGDCALSALMRDRRSPAAGPLRRLARAAARGRRGLDFRRATLPLLAGGAALTVTPASGGPALTLAAEGVDRARALEVLGSLQPALIALVRPLGIGRAPGFAATEIDGVPAFGAELAPGLELTYAAFDGRLAVSTRPEGIAAARADGNLEGSDAFELVLGDRPRRPTAVGFLDLDKLLALGGEAGLGGDPSLLAARDDLQQVGIVGATLTRGEEHTNMEIDFKTP